MGISMKSVKKGPAKPLNPQNFNPSNPGQSGKDAGLPYSTGSLLGRKSAIGGPGSKGDNGNLKSKELGNIPEYTRESATYEFKPLDNNEADANYFNDNSGELKRNEQLKSAVDRRFDFLRAKTEGAANEASQQQNDALTRQAAARGRLGSGNFQKQSQQLNKGLEAQKGNAVGDVESQRELALAQQDEASAQRAYQSEEAAKQRAFTADQAKIQRGFDRDVFNKESAFKAQAFNEQNAQFSDQMKAKFIEMGMDRDISQFNMDMAVKQFNKKDMSEWFANLNGYNARTGQYGPPIDVIQGRR